MQRAGGRAQGRVWAWRAAPCGQRSHPPWECPAAAGQKLRVPRLPSTCRWVGVGSGCRDPYGARRVEQGQLARVDQPHSSRLLVGLRADARHTLCTAVPLDSMRQFAARVCMQQGLLWQPALQSNRQSFHGHAAHTTTSCAASMFDPCCLPCPLCPCMCPSCFLPWLPPSSNWSSRCVVHGLGVRGAACVAKQLFPCNLQPPAVGPSC